MKPGTLTLTRQTYLEHKLKLLQKPELQLRPNDNKPFLAASSMAHQTMLVPQPTQYQVPLAPALTSLTNLRTTASEPVPEHMMALFNDALEQSMFHIQWNCLMHCFNLEPDFIFKLPSFRESQRKVIRKGWQGVLKTGGG